MIIKRALRAVLVTVGIAICSGVVGDGDTGVAGLKDWSRASEEQSRAMSLQPDRARGIAVYEVCSACHLPEGWGLTDGSFPQLAGQHRNVLIKQLSDIRSHHRDNPTMYPFTLDEQILTVAGYKAGEIEPAQLIADVTDYISKLPMNPDFGIGPWAKGTPEFKQGKRLYTDNCTNCHGKDGEGDDDRFYPRIQGQYYNYMLRQFERIRDGRRGNAHPDMAKLVKGFSDKDMKMVINYASHLRPPKEDLAPSRDWTNPDYD
jgi:cytochrome c553